MTHALIHEMVRYRCLNERSGLMRPGKMRRLPGGDLLNSPKRTTRNTEQKGGIGGVSTHRTPCTPAGGGALVLLVSGSVGIRCVGSGDLVTGG